MKELELLAPARNADIGIAAIDCGADAVYIGGPLFGARYAAGNSLEDIARLCSYAHRYGARVFVTINIELTDNELAEARALMLAAQDAGADAFIIRDLRLCTTPGIKVPLHASTQCAIRSVERARECVAAGCSRIVLERELSLAEVRKICSAVSCEVEFFVHGALCVCYSGDCRLSEYLDGRSADRGECVQACRSLYDLEDASGRKLVRSKALLSLKDLNLKNRISDLAAAGVCSFKVEGRLKNASYVKNVVRDYSLALDALVSSNPLLYRRASYGQVRGGFAPDTERTFNRGYTSLDIDGERGGWAAIDAPKSMGKAIGTIRAIRQTRAGQEISVSPSDRSLELHNGDGFAVLLRDSIVGFRGDICQGATIVCKGVDGLQPGQTIWRNSDAAFEKTLETRLCRREIDVNLKIVLNAKGLTADAASEDGRHLCPNFGIYGEPALNPARSLSMLHDGLSKRSAHYNFTVTELTVAPDTAVPLMQSSAINAIRRDIADALEQIPCGRIPMANRAEMPADTQTEEQATGKTSTGHHLSADSELMRTRYCIRHELGMCPVHQGAKPSGPLFLVNNGRRLALGFDCAHCEMTVSPVRK